MISYPMKVQDEAGPNTEKKIRELIDTINQINLKALEAAQKPVLIGNQESLISQAIQIALAGKFSPVLKFAPFFSLTPGAIPKIDPTGHAIVGSIINENVVDGEHLIGIGKVATDYTVDVYGSLNAGALLVNGVPVSTGGSTQWGNNGADIYYIGGKVGVGTNAPGAEFSVDTELLIGRHNSSSGDAVLYIGPYTTAKTYAASIRYNDATANLDIAPRTGYNTVFAAGKVGIGADPGIYHLQIQGPTYSIVGIKAAGTNQAAGLDLISSYATADQKNWNLQSYGGAFGINLLNDARYSAINMLTILPSGNVGIGALNPVSKLDIYGTKNQYGGVLYIGDSATQGIGVGGGLVFYGHSNFLTDSYEGASIQAYKENATIHNYATALVFGTATAAGAMNPAMAISSIGNVGIGLLTPARKLEVSVASPSGDDGFRISYSGVPSAYYGEWAQHYNGPGLGFSYRFNVADADTEYSGTPLVIGPTGFVGIRTGGYLPQASLQVAADGNGSFIGLSIGSNSIYNLIATDVNNSFVVKTWDGEEWVSALTLLNSGNAVLPGSVGIGTLVPNAKSILDLSSTTKGFLPPRMSTTERDAISSPPEGLNIHNTTLHKSQFHNGTEWVNSEGDLSLYQLLSGKDILSGYAAILANGDVVAPGDSLELTRNVSGNIAIAERTSQEVAVAFHRYEANEYGGYLTQGGSAKAILTEYNFPPTVFPPYWSPTYHAEDYIGSTAITWYVVSGNIETFKCFLPYSAVGYGKKMGISISIIESEISNASYGNCLMIKIPGSKLPTGTFIGPCQIVWTASGYAPVFIPSIMISQYNDPWLYIQRSDGYDFPNGSALLYLVGTIEFEVQ